MVIWNYACNTSTYDNDACNDKIFMMKNCLDIHNLIIHPLSWFWNRCKRKKEVQNCILSSFFTMTKGEIASLYKSRRCKNLIANLLISRRKIVFLNITILNISRSKTCNLHIAIGSKNHELTQEIYLAFAFEIFASLYIVKLVYHKNC